MPSSTVCVDPKTSLPSDPATASSTPSHPSLKPEVLTCSFSHLVATLVAGQVQVSVDAAHVSSPRSAESVAVVSTEPPESPAGAETENGGGRRNGADSGSKDQQITRDSGDEKQQSSKGNQKQDLSGPTFQIEGFIVRKRCMSKRLVFYDVVQRQAQSHRQQKRQPSQEREGTESIGALMQEESATKTTKVDLASVQCLELLCKWPSLSLDHIVAIQRGAAVGDLVRVQGQVEVTNKGLVVLHVRAFHVLVKHPAWGDVYASKTQRGQLHTGLEHVSRQNPDSKQGDVEVQGESVSASEFLWVDSYVAWRLQGGVKRLLKVPTTCKLPIDDDQLLAEVCKTFWVAGSCSKDGCTLRHCYKNKREEKRFAWLRNSRIQRQQQDTHIQQQRLKKHKPAQSHAQQEHSQAGHEHEYLPDLPGRKRPKNGVYRHCLRAGVFVQWLVDVFGHDGLTDGTGVLDVAGGRGEISFELFCKRSIPSTLIDPRPLRLTKQQRKFLKKRRKRLRTAVVGHDLSASPDGCHTLSDTASASAPASLPTGMGDDKGCGEECGEEALRARQWRTLFDDEFIAGARALNICPASTFPNTQRTSPSVEVASAPSKPASGHVGAHSTPTELGIQARSHDQQLHAPQPYCSTSGELLAGCSVLVGMHPDQVTEPIVDTALRLNKAFAVVPCCVFPNLRPDRRTATGEPVVEYDDFIDYLCAKSEDIQVARLGFQGRNQVVFRLPPKLTA